MLVQRIPKSTLGFTLAFVLATGMMMMMIITVPSSLLFPHYKQSHTIRIKSFFMLSKVIYLSEVTRERYYNQSCYGYNLSILSPHKNYYPKLCRGARTTQMDNA
jgi:hypothetical protein